MRKLKRTVFIVIGLLLLATILIETDVLSTTTNSQLSSESSSNWSGQATEIADSALTNTPNAFNQKSCKLLNRFDRVPLRVEYGELHYGAPVNCHTVVIHLNQLDIGTIWSPIINSTKFETSVNVGFKFTIHNDVKKTYIMYDKSGTISIHGSLEISGICSNSKVKTYVTHNVLKVVYENVREQLAKEQQKLDDQ